jgi:hypothetical protein
MQAQLLSAYLVNNNTCALFGCRYAMTSSIQEKKLIRHDRACNQEMQAKLMKYPQQQHECNDACMCKQPWF